MNHDELRLECLRLAQAAEDHGTTTTRPDSLVIGRARAYADFVLARRDGPILCAADELVKALNQ